MNRVSQRRRQLLGLTKSKLFGGKWALPGDIDPASYFLRAATFLETLVPNFI